MPEMRNTPTQRRSEERVWAIKAAAEKLYDDPAIGRDRMTTNDVAKEAGCSIGTVYRYFDDIVDILDAIRPDRDKAAEQLAQIKTVLETDMTHEARVAAIAGIING